MRTDYLLCADSEKKYYLNPYRIFSFEVIDFDKHFNLFFNFKISLQHTSNLPFFVNAGVSVLNNSSLCQINANPHVPLSLKEENTPPFSRSLALDGDILKIDLPKEPIVHNKFFDRWGDDFKMKGGYCFKKITAAPKILDAFNETAIREALLSFDSNHGKTEKFLPASEFLKKFSGEWAFKQSGGKMMSAKCGAKFFNEAFVLFNFPLGQTGLFRHIYMAEHDYNMSDASSELYLDGFIKTKRAIAKQGRASRWDNPKNVVLANSAYAAVKPLMVLYFNPAKGEVVMARCDVLLEETQEGINRKYNTSQYFFKAPDGEIGGEIIWEPFVPGRGIVRVPEIRQKLKWEIAPDFSEIKEYRKDGENWVLQSVMKKETPKG